MDDESRLFVALPSFSAKEDIKAVETTKIATNHYSKRQPFGRASFCYPYLVFC